MKKLFALLILCLSISAVSGQGTGDTPNISYMLPIKYEIANINVTGDSYLGKQTVLAIAGLYTGLTVSIPGEEITKGILNLWKQGFFSDVKIYLDKTEGNLAYLTIHVQTRPRISRFNFPGLSKGQANKLKDEVGVKGGDIVTEQLMANATQRIRNYYAGKGYPNATVSITEDPDTLFKGNSVVVHFHVDRGQRTKINEISFEGNTAFTEKQLQRVMKKTKERTPYNPLRSSKLLEKEFEADKQRLIAYYNAHGYKDAKIVTDSVYSYEDNLYNVHIKISEGRKYYFRNVSWTGNTIIPDDTLNLYLNIKRGEIYNPEKLERNLFMSENGLDVTSAYMDDGYLFFSATPVETHIEGDSIDIEIRIFEGPQAIVDRVTIVGNTRTHDHVFLREIRTRPGDIFSRSDVVRTQRDLVNTGLIDPAEIQVIPTPNPQTGTVDLEYRVVEKPNDQIELSGGWGGRQIVGVLGLSLNNFSTRNVFRKNSWQGYPSGDAQRLTLRAQAQGQFFQSYNFSFTDPWFGGKKPNSLSVSAFYSIQRGFFGGTDPDLRQELRTPGVSVSFGKRLVWPDDWFVLFHSINYQHFIFTEYTLIPGYPTGTSNNLNFKHTLTRNSASDPIYPEFGSIFNLSLQWTPPFSLLSGKDYTDLPPAEKYRWLEYHKWKFDAVNFHSLLRTNKGKNNFVLMSQVSFGMMGYYNSSLGFSPFERFFIGGDGLNNFALDGREVIRLRGYNAPDDLLLSINGGSIYNKFTFEIRYPFAKTQAAQIYGLVFAEGGNNALRLAEYNPFDMKKAAGAGIRVNLPMFGLLGFDVGYMFDRPATLGVNEPFGNRWGFNIFIGQGLF
ncbi:MAG: outer membrane protein assembly factor BamA [Bacteroidota bacterium]|nr:outer membrane protein assembly factor BamA [Bacteroidota bacterium]